MQDSGAYLEEPDAMTEAIVEPHGVAPVSCRGATESGGSCCRCSCGCCDCCSRLQPPAAAPAAFPGCRLPEQRQHSERLLPHKLRPGAPASLPPATMLILAVCALVGVAVSYALARLEDDRDGGGSSRCDAAVTKFELGKVVRKAVERFGEKALPMLRGYVRQPPTAFLPFAGANDEDECLLPTRDALSTAGLSSSSSSSHDSTAAFTVTAQGRLGVSNSGYYYVFSQVDTQRVAARTEAVHIQLLAIRSHTESVDVNDSSENGSRPLGKSASTTNKGPKQSEQSVGRHSEDVLTDTVVTPWTSSSEGQIEAPTVYSGLVVQLHAGDELRIKLLCDRSGSGSGHRCGSASAVAAEACGRYHIGAHLIAPVNER